MDICVADVMSERVIAVRQNAGFAEIAEVMRRFAVASLPVIDGDHRVIGLVSEDDMLLKEARRGRGGIAGWRHHRAERRKMAGATARDLMTAPAVSVTASTPAREAARTMYRRRIHQLPVVDPATGRLRGIVTRSDLLGVYDRPDEDIRREIRTDVIEDDLRMDPSRFAVTVADGTVTISGRLERRSAIPDVIEAIERVDGVVAVTNHLTYRWDDSAPMPRAHR